MNWLLNNAILVSTSFEQRLNLKHIPREKLTGLPFTFSFLLTSCPGKPVYILRKSKGVYIYIYIGRLSRWLSVNNLSATAGDTGSILGLGKSPGERKWQPTPVFLPGKTHGQRSLAGYSSWDHKRVRHDLATKQQQHMGRQRHSPKTILYRSSKVLLSPVW